LVSVLVLGCLVLASCGRAIDRPLRGAAPGSEPTAPVGAPPTLAPSDALRFRALPSPSAGGASGSPVASPSASAAPAPPIVRTINPAANGNVAPGAPVTVSAVLVGRGADLATASLAINGADSGAQIDKRTPREWTIHTSQAFGPGSYTARVLVRDSSGAAGGFTWQFVVGEAESSPPQAPAPAPPAAPAPAPPAAPAPAPPTAPAPAPAARPTAAPPPAATPTPTPRRR
jgi:pyruvate dehydrogenase E2 component (dihydrolipoyllysine-residue acetyltransferase)